MADSEIELTSSDQVKLISARPVNIYFYFIYINKIHLYIFEIYFSQFLIIG